MSDSLEFKYEQLSLISILRCALLQVPCWKYSRADSFQAKVQQDNSCITGQINSMGPYKSKNPCP